jgi:nicotinate phosphoribosyltransferase
VTRVDTPNGFVTPLLTDLYELTMAYAYWKAGRHEDRAVFDLFFRKNPFGGEFTVFAGLDEVVGFLERFRFGDAEIAHVRSLLPAAGAEFERWLGSVDASGVTVAAPREGSFVFPLVPLLRVEGPLAIVQLLETTLLNLVNYPSLVATNALRMRIAAGMKKGLVEFGLRRAQGPDGGVSASRYSYLGGFDGTSNVLAGRLYGIPVRGTVAHSFISSFSGLGDIDDGGLEDAGGARRPFLDLVVRHRNELGFTNADEGELAAFVAYARAFPRGFLALVDVYDTLHSGLPNFLCVALALHDLGYEPVGIRLDSGDLAYLSRRARAMFREVGAKTGVPLEKLTIVASNDLNEKTIESLERQGHEIDVFGVGTQLVTCQAQPSLGGVYKLVEVNGRPAVKVSQDLAKATIPCRKEVYRLLGREGWPIADLLTGSEEPAPRAGERTLCRHPYEETKRALITPAGVVRLLEVAWRGGRTAETPTLQARRAFALEQLASFREDHLRPVNPTPYKVSLSDPLYALVHRLWLEHAPVKEME